MAGTRKNPNPKRTSQYTGVSWQENTLKGADAKAGWWVATITRDGKRLIKKLYSADDERGAAKAVDIALIKAGYSPINGTLTRIL